MANNFYNAVVRNLSADSTLPTAVYTTPNGLKSILIELDVSNKSTAGVTVTVQLEDESLNESGGDAHTVTVATGVTGLITTTNAAAHNLIVNDRVVFGGTASRFTDASLPASGETVVSATRMYYVQSIPSDSTFTIAETKSGTLLTFDTTGSSVVFTKIHLADIIKDAPVPVGGTLKVISGQKLVLESPSSGVQDKVYAYSSAANAVDAIGSVLQEVS